MAVGHPKMWFVGKLSCLYGLLLFSGEDLKFPHRIYYYHFHNCYYNYLFTCKSRINLQLYSLSFFTNCALGQFFVFPLPALNISLQMTMKSRSRRRMRIVVVCFNYCTLSSHLIDNQLVIYYMYSGGDVSADEWVNHWWHAGHLNIQVWVVWASVDSFLLL